jgi:hypothetical protein
LTGWFIERGDPAVWSVADNNIVVRSHNDFRKMGFPLTNRDYTDFVVRFQFKLPRNADRGFVFRASPGEAGTPIDLNIRSFIETPSLMAALFWSKSGRGADALLPSRPAQLRSEESWNEMQAECRGDLLTAYVNGQKVLEANLKELSKARNPKEGLSRRTGRIGFQAHTNTVRFRNIEVKELK